MRPWNEWTVFEAVVTKKGGAGARAARCLFISATHCQTNLEWFRNTEKISRFHLGVATKTASKLIVTDYNTNVILFLGEL